MGRSRVDVSGSGPIELRVTTTLPVLANPCGAGGRGGSSLQGDVSLIVTPRESGTLRLTVGPGAAGVQRRDFADRAAYDAGNFTVSTVREDSPILLEAGTAFGLTVRGNWLAEAQAVSLTDDVFLTLSVER